MRTGKIVLAFCTTLAMIGGVIQYANNMPSNTENFSQVALTSGEMEATLAGFGGGGSGGGDTGGGGGTVDVTPKPKYRNIYEDFGPTTDQYFYSNSLGSGTLVGEATAGGGTAAISKIFFGASVSASANSCTAWEIKQDIYKVVQPYKVFSVQVDKNGNDIPGTKAYVEDRLRETGAPLKPGFAYAVTRRC